MKKLILFILFLLLVSNVLAISPPLLPFPFGQEIIIDGQPGSNLMVKIEDKNFDSIRTTTNEQGQFLIDLSNFGNVYSVGDKFKVTIYRGDEQRTYEVIIDKEEGGMFFRKSIQWDAKTYSESEKEPDSSTVLDYLKEQDQKNYEENLKERKISYAIAITSILISLLFFLGSWKITKYYAEKHDCKYAPRKVKRKRKK